MSDIILEEKVVPNTQKNKPTQCSRQLARNLLLI